MAAYKLNTLRLVGHERASGDIGEAPTQPADTVQVDRAPGGPEESSSRALTDTASVSGVPAPEFVGLVDDGERRKVQQALFGDSNSSFTLGRYVITGTLGQGGMGVVFKAFDPELDRRVALKVLHAELDERHTTRLRREAQAMAKLSHPNVVHVYEVGQVEGRTFVAMEQVKGQTLKEWMSQDPRPDWRQCVEVFIQVGRGLAAAHERGLVHRDFKPGNAMLDDKEHARVLDFGLACKLDSVESSIGITVPTAVQRARTDEQHVVPLEVSLTNTGALLGTPAYMPPEQIQRQEADARSDQFSFCVALYEAIYGERPFDGGSIPGLLMSINAGEVRPVPRGSAVPNKLRAVLLRGLAARPENRWRSMEELLERLERLVAPRTRRGLVLGVALGLVGLGTALAVPQLLAMRERCSGAQDKLVGTWDDARRQQVKDAVLGTKLVHAADAYRRIEERLDDYADNWADKHTDACEATMVRHEQTEEAMTLRIACLDESLTSLHATTKLLANADAKVVGNAVDLISDLPDPARCRDVKRLEQQYQRMPPPADLQVAVQVEELRERLTEIKAKRQAGRSAEAFDQIQAVVEDAEALGYGPLRAEAVYWRGELFDRDGHHVEAAQYFKRAYALAVEHHHDQIALDAAQRLTYLTGTTLAGHLEGLTWGHTAVALAKASGDDLEHATSLKNLGSVFATHGEHHAAKVRFQEALRLRRAYGDDHPDVGTSHQDMGTVLFSLGKYGSAKFHFLRALQIFEGMLGADHPNVAVILTDLGTVSYRIGKYERAKEHYVRALRIFEEMSGPDDPKVSRCLQGLGVVLHRLGEYGEAKVHFARALRIQEKTRGTAHPDTVQALIGMARTALAQDDIEVAREHAERVMSVRMAPETPPQLQAEAGFVLAQALWSDKAERSRARTLAKQARKVFTEHGEETEEQLAEVDAWLTGHRT